MLALISMFFAAPVFAADMLSVSARQANVRSGPGSGYEVVWRAARYYPLQVLDSDGAWIMVSDYENEEGWISRSLLAAVPAVVVVSEKANVREGPGLDYDVLWEVETQYSLKVLGSEGNWYKVSDGGELTGWIHKTVTWGFADAELEPRQPL
ncbi:MAG: SH3 domain-containing protein [Elusimicrobiales bacterium]